MTAYDVVLHPAARRELNAVPPEDFRRLDPAIRALGSTPRPHGVTKLEGDLHRIREGIWRVVYAVQDIPRRIVILHVIRRNERTYKRFRTPW